MSDIPFQPSEDLTNYVMYLDMCWEKGHLPHSDFCSAILSQARHIRAQSESASLNLAAMLSCLSIPEERSQYPKLRNAVKLAFALPELKP